MDQLRSTNPATGAEVGRFPVAGPAEVAGAVERARAAGQWWSGLGFGARRRLLLRWRALLARRMTALADLLHAEIGKPRAEGLIEAAAAIGDVDWAARNARRVLAPRRVRRVLPLIEASAHLEYRPYGVVGAIGPWNYPVLTPIGAIAYALAAGNAVVHKPSEHTPAIGQWLVDTFAEVVDRPVLQVVHGDGDTGAALCRSGVDKLAFTGSSATAKRIMATCAETLTPVVLEAGGKDAMIVDTDAELDAAAEACVFGAFTNAGQACVGLERAYVAAPVYEDFLARVVDRASRLTVGASTTADLGPIITPEQLDIVRHHIDDALGKGARAVLGGADAVHPPFVYPTILVDVPEDALAIRDETFGPTLVVTPVRDMAEAVRRANDSPYGLGAAVFADRQAVAIARALRCGMVAVNDALSFAGMPSLPWGGVGSSGIGRLRGDDGLREFGQAKSIVVRRGPSPVRTRTFSRTDRDLAGLVAGFRIRYGRAPD